MDKLEKDGALQIELPMLDPGQCGCGPSVENDRHLASAPGMDQAFVLGSHPTANGPVPKVSSRLTGRDRVGAALVRLGIGRMSYRVDPGLYALGDPSPDSPVLVSANYKLSFDHLRLALPGQSAWILVLDTDGVNVWCAAGKGTFGTEELVSRIAACRMEEVVTHRRIILPQLCAPGVAAHLVKRHSGFEAVFGPVRAGDLPAFLATGKATPEMRRVTFSLGQRAVVIPVELTAAARHLAWLLPLVYLLGGLWGPQPFWSAAAEHGLLAAVALLGAVLAGAVAAPLLLPWLPGRAFALKGLWCGLAAALILATQLFWRSGTTAHYLETAGWGLLITALASFLAMNFTGASTYTSLSGVKKEMRRAVPWQIAGAALGITLWTASFFSA